MHVPQNNFGILNFASSGFFIFSVSFFFNDFSVSFWYCENGLRLLSLFSRGPSKASTSKIIVYKEKNHVLQMCAVTWQVTYQTDMQ